MAREWECIVLNPDYPSETLTPTPFPRSTRLVHQKLKEQAFGNWNTLNNHGMIFRKSSDPDEGVEECLKYSKIQNLECVSGSTFNLIAEDDEYDGEENEYDSGEDEDDRKAQVVYILICGQKHRKILKPTLNLENKILRSNVINSTQQSHMYCPSMRLHMSSIPLSRYPAGNPEKSEGSHGAKPSYLSFKLPVTPRNLSSSLPNLQSEERQIPTQTLWQ